MWFQTIIQDRRTLDSVPEVSCISCHLMSPSSKVMDCATQNFDFIIVFYFLHCISCHLMHNAANFTLMRVLGLIFALPTYDFMCFVYTDMRLFLLSVHLCFNLLDHHNRICSFGKLSLIVSGFDVADVILYRRKENW